MHLSPLDWFMMFGVICAAMAVAVTCLVGLVVWLAGSESNCRR